VLCGHISDVEIFFKVRVNENGLAQSKSALSVGYYYAHDDTFPRAVSVRGTAMATFVDILLPSFA
jgi:hypothetical protein